MSDKKFREVISCFAISLIFFAFSFAFLAEREWAYCWAAYASGVVATLLGFLFRASPETP